MTHFREEQRYRQRWVWAILLTIGVAATGYVAWAMLRRFVFMPPPGGRPLVDHLQMLVSLLMLGLMWGLTWMVYELRLVVEVSDERVVVQFEPIARRVCLYITDIEAASIRRYIPSHHGGWGSATVPGGRAFTVSGYRCVAVETRGGDRYLIGTQRADDLYAAIIAACEALPNG